MDKYNKPVKRQCNLMDMFKNKATKVDKVDDHIAIDGIDIVQSADKRIVSFCASISESEVLVVHEQMQDMTDAERGEDFVSCTVVAQRL